MSASAATAPRDAEQAGQPERPDVFISYSRKDEEFVRELHAALAGRGKDVWVDWEDIRKSADWRVTIETGIASARAVVAVLSPDFTTSEVCAAEIEHAVRTNKRIVPVVRRETDRTLLRDELNAPNWIFFRETDDYEARFEELVEALETDLGWHDQHARLLVRAMEWDRRGRDASLLLRGSDLEAAEGWLAEQGSHRETATPLQGEYIAVSRRGARRRQRIVLAAVLVALVVTAALAVLAWLQRNEAIEQRDQAFSRELAASAVSQLGVDPELSVLLGLEATEVAPTPEARDAVRRALLASHIRKTLRGHRGPLSTVAFDRDGRTVLTSARDGTARLWKTSDGEEIAVLRGHRGPVRSAAFGPGDLVLTASEDGTARVWDTDTGDEARRPARPRGRRLDGRVQP